MDLNCFSLFADVYRVEIYFKCEKGSQKNQKNSEAAEYSCSPSDFDTCWERLRRVHLFCWKCKLRTK